MKEQRKAEKFLKRLASKLPAHIKAEDESFLSLFENLIETLDDASIRQAILTNVEYFFSIFENAVKEASPSITTTTAGVTNQQTSNAVVSLIQTRIYLGTKTFLNDDSKDDFHEILLSVQCNRRGQFDCVKIAQMLVRSSQTKPLVISSDAAITATELSNTLLSKLVLQGTDNSERTCLSVGCIWAYCAIFGSHHSSLLPALLLLSSNAQDLWIYAFGFLGFWGRNSTEGNMAGRREENNTMIYALLVNFLESSCTEDVDNRHVDVLPLSLSVLYSWIYSHPTSSVQTSLLHILTDELTRGCPHGQGNALTFWSDVLLPKILPSGMIKQNELRMCNDAATSSKGVGGIMNWLSESKQVHMQDAMSVSLSRLLIHHFGSGIPNEEGVEADDNEDEHESNDHRGGRKRSRDYNDTKEGENEEEVEETYFFIDTVGNSSSSSSSRTVSGSVTDIPLQEIEGAEDPSEMEQELQRLVNPHTSARKSGKSKTKADDSSTKQQHIIPGSGKSKTKADEKTKSDDVSTKQQHITPGSNKISARPVRENKGTTNRWAFLGESFPSAKKQVLTTGENVLGVVRPVSTNKRSRSSSK